MQTINKNGLTVKDLVTVGIFPALFLVFALVGGIFFAPNPVLTFYMDNLSGVSTRVVMLVTEGLFSTAVMTLAVFAFDWRVGLLITAGLVIYGFVNHALQRRSEITTRRKLAGDTAVVERVLGFIKGIARPILAGGRYDNLMEVMGKESAGAIGFSISMDSLEELNRVRRDIDVDVVILDQPWEDLNQLNQVVRDYTDRGLSVSVQKRVPKKLRYRELVRIENGEVKTVERDD